MADQKVRTDITADAGQAIREFNSFGSAVSSASATIGGAFTTVKTAAMGLQSTFGLLAAAAASSAFVQGISHQIDLMDATGKSAQAAGVSTEAYSELAYAAKLADVESEVLTKSLVKLGNSVIKAAGGDQDLRHMFESTLKVKLRDAAGQIRDTDQVLMDLADRFADFPDGPRKSALAVEVFGERIGPRLIPFLNQGRQGIEELREELRRMGGSVGSEQAKAAEVFNDSMTRIRTSAGTVVRSIAGGFLPTLADLAGKLADAAASGEIFAKVLNRIRDNAGFGDLAIRRKELEQLNMQLQLKGFQLENLANAAQRNPDNKSYADQTRVLRGEVEDLMRRVAAASQAVLPDEQRYHPVGGGRGFVNPPFVVPDKRGNDDEPDPPQPKAPDLRMQQWQAQLDAWKVAHEQRQTEAGTFYAFGQDKEAGFWKNILDTLKGGDSQRLAVQRQYYRLVLDMRKGDFEAEQAELQTRIDAARGNFTEQEELARLYTSRAAQRFGQESKEYQAALKQQQAMYRTHRDAMQQVDSLRRQRDRDQQLEDVGMLERGAQLERDLGVITQQQLLAVRGQAIEVRRQIEESAKLGEVEAMKNNPNADPVALERLESELAAIRAKYRTAKAENQGAQTVEQGKPLDAILGTSQQALEQGLQAMAERMKVTWGGVRDVIVQVGRSVLSELVIKPAAAWVAQQARMVVLTALFGRQRVASEAATAVQVGGINTALSLRNIAASAAEAAANAYKSIAAIPVVGPVMAPIAAGLALAAVTALGRKVFSAEGGFDIPRGLNPMVQLHQEEMVLPSAPANALRSIAERMGQGQTPGAASTLDVQVHVSGQVGDFYMITKHQLVKALKSARRDLLI